MNMSVLRLRVLIASCILLGLGSWVLWLGITWQRALPEPPAAMVSDRPEVIAVLGGGIRRETRAAELAQHYRDLPILISSGSTRPCLYRVFVQEQGIPWPRITANFRATDTLTNFTALLPILEANQVQKVLLVTSEGHWPRAAVLSRIIWGSRGIAVEPVLVEGVGHQETWLKTMADSVRAIAWVLLGERIVQPFYASESQVNYQQNLKQSGCEIGDAVLPGFREPPLRPPERRQENSR